MDNMVMAAMKMDVIDWRWMDVRVVAVMEMVGMEMAAREVLEMEIEAMVFVCFWWWRWWWIHYHLHYQTHEHEHSARAELDPTVGGREETEGCVFLCDGDGDEVFNSDLGGGGHGA